MARLVRGVKGARPGRTCCWPGWSAARTVAGGVCRRAVARVAGTVAGRAVARVGRGTIAAAVTGGSVDGGVDRGVGGAIGSSGLADAVGRGALRGGGGQ